MTTITQTRLSFSPLNLELLPLRCASAAAALGTLVSAIRPQIEVPDDSVLITLQTLIVPLIGALYGWRLGMATVLAWLGEAMLDFRSLQAALVVFRTLQARTAGYLLLFLIIAALTGYLAERGLNGNASAWLFVSFLAANVVCLARRGLAVQHHWPGKAVARRDAVSSWRPHRVGLGAAILKAIARDGKAPDRPGDSTGKAAITSLHTTLPAAATSSSASSRTDRFRRAAERRRRYSSRRWPGRHLRAPALAIAIVTKRVFASVTGWH